MQLNLKNGYEYNLPCEGRLLLFGANRIGKTLISKEVNNYYENIEGYKVLLFNDDLLQSSFISSNENKNRYIVTPYAEEKKTIKNNLYEVRKELEIVPKLVKYFGEKTTKAYEKFPIIIEMLNNTIAIKNDLVEVFPGDEMEAQFNEPIFDYDGKTIEPEYDSEFINKCINKKTGTQRFLELIEALKKEGIFSKTKNVSDLFNDINSNEYFVKEKIISDNLQNCPICYSEITEANRKKIISDLSKIILKDELKKSLNYYINSDDKRFEEIIINLISNYDDTYNNFIYNLEQSILSILSKEFDIKKINIYKQRIEELENINKKTKNFIIEQEQKDSEIHKEIDKEFDIFKTFSNTELHYEIKAGQVEISIDNGRITELSMSEIKFLKFIYFRILFLQNIRINPLLKMIVIVDDPFDSYDDIYVSNMIEIIFDLLKLNQATIEKFIVLSHSFLSLRLLNERYNNVGVNFKFYWLDIFKDNKEIININDEFKIMTKIDNNISDFGLAMKIIQKMRDSYSLIVFSSLLRENSKFNYRITKTKCRTIKKCIVLHRSYYSIVSNNVNHDKSRMNIEQLHKLNKKMYGFPDIVYMQDIKTINDVFNNIPRNSKDLCLYREYRKNRIELWKTNDLMHLLVWKFLTVLKIRRILEKKIWIELSKPKYATLSDLIKMYDENSITNNYRFYDNYKILFNSFNHTTTENIPPFLIFHADYIQDVLEKVEKL